MENEISKKCSICPRQCMIERNLQNGFCNEGTKIRIAKIIKNFKWEEPCITGKKGCLAIFFSGCNLRCDYCQNHEISRGGKGKLYTIEEFANLIENHQENHDFIDLISPTQFSKEITTAFENIRKTIPVVWNTNSYETIENIKNVGKFVDIFLADFKYANDEIGRKFSACQNYFSASKLAIAAMCKEKKDVFEDDKMLQGVLIRHLVLPGHVENSLKVLDYIKENLLERKISIMSQFTPNGKSNLNRKINPIEYKLVLSHMEKLGLANGYVQEYESADKSFVPNFF